jgi:hypothetical protein
MLARALDERRLVRMLRQSGIWPAMRFVYGVIHLIARRVVGVNLGDTPASTIAGWG